MFKPFKFTKPHFKKSSLVWISAFLLPVFFSYRKVLLTPGMIGFSWDWSILPHPFQETERIVSQFIFAWNPNVSMGIDALRDAAGPYFFLFMWPFSFFGGAFLSKFLIVFLTVLAGATAFWFLKSLQLHLWGVLVGALFYMLSPYVYARVVAGHISQLWSYALIPLLVMLLRNCLKSDRFVVKDVLLLGVVYALTASNFVVLGTLAVIVFVLVFGYLAVALVKRQGFKPAFFAWARFICFCSF